MSIFYAKIYTDFSKVSHLRIYLKFSNNFLKIHKIYLYSIFSNFTTFITESVRIFLSKCYIFRLLNKKYFNFNNF